MTWAPGWYGFDPDSEMCEAWGPNGSEADAKVHPSLDVHPSEHGAIKTFLVLDAAQARQLLTDAPDQKLRAVLEGVDALPASTATGPPIPPEALRVFILGWRAYPDARRVCPHGVANVEVWLAGYDHASDMAYTKRTGEWLTCEQIAERWKDATPSRVSSMLAHLGYSGDLHGPEVVALLERELRGRGYERASEAGLDSCIQAVAEGALDAAKFERMALAGPGPASGVEFTFTPIELGACESSPRPATFRRGAQAYCRHLARVIPDDMRDVPIYCAAWLAGYDHAAAAGLPREPLQPIDKDTLTYIRSRVAAFATIDATDARELLAAYDLLT